MNVVRVDVHLEASDAKEDTTSPAAAFAYAAAKAIGAIAAEAAADAASAAIVTASTALLKALEALVLKAFRAALASSTPSEALPLVQEEVLAWLDEQGLHAGIGAHVQAIRDELLARLQQAQLLQRQFALLKQGGVAYQHRYQDRNLAAHAKSVHDKQLSRERRAFLLHRQLERMQRASIAEAVPFYYRPAVWYVETIESAQRAVTDSIENNLQSVLGV